MQDRIDTQVDAALSIIEQGQRSHDEMRSLLKRLVWTGAVLYKKEERKARGARFRAKHKDTIKTYQDNYRAQRKAGVVESG